MRWSWARPQASEGERRWVHLALLGLTAITTSAAGAWFWEGAIDAGDGWRRLADLEVLSRGAAYAAWLLAILGAHEIGHVLACRYHGIPSTLPYFVPGLPPVGTFGAVIRIRGAIPNRRALFDVAAAGPIAGFVVTVPALVAGLVAAAPSQGEPQGGELLLGAPLLSVVIGHAIHGDVPLRVGSAYGAGWVGLLITSMNLFPTGQLDGGHAAYAVSRRLHRVLSWATCGGLGAWVVAQAIETSSLPAYALWLVVLVVMRDRHPRLLDESTPLGRGRTAVALVLAAIFVLAVIPVPLEFVDGP